MNNYNTLLKFTFNQLVKFIYKFYYNPSIIKIYKQFLNINNYKHKIIDIGCDRGQYLNLILSNYNLLIEYIFAFEPNYETFNFLKKNFTNSNITFFNYALGAKNFRSKINIGFDSSHSSLSSINKNSKYYNTKKKILGTIYKKKQPINVVKLDNFIRLFLKEDYKKKSNKKKMKIKYNYNNKNFIVKIDAEGYELNVLNGMKNFFKKNLINFIQIEIHLDDMYRNYSHNKIYNLLEKMNFKEIKFLKFPFMPWGDAFFVRYK